MQYNSDIFRKSHPFLYALLDSPWKLFVPLPSCTAQPQCRATQKDHWITNACLLYELEGRPRWCSTPAGKSTVQYAAGLGSEEITYLWLTHYQITSKKVQSLLLLTTNITDSFIPFNSCLDLFLDLEVQEFISLTDVWFRQRYSWASCHAVFTLDTQYSVKIFASMYKHWEFNASFWWCANLLLADRVHKGTCLSKTAIACTASFASLHSTYCSFWFFSS